MSLAIELRLGRSARRFFENEARMDLGSAGELLQPSGAIVPPVPNYRTRDGWALAEAMTTLLIQYDLQGGSLDVAALPAYQSVALEPRFNHVNKTAPSSAAHCLCAMAAAALASNPPMMSNEALKAMYALAIADTLRLRGEWPGSFEWEFRAGVPLGGGDGYQPTQSDYDATVLALHNFWLNDEGAKIFADVALTLQCWTTARRNRETEIASIELCEANAALQFGNLVGGAWPDLIARVHRTETLLAVRNVNGRITANEVRLIAGMLMLGGSITGCVEQVGILYPRRATLQRCDTRSFLTKVFGDDDLAKWSKRFRAHLAKGTT